MKPDFIAMLFAVRDYAHRQHLAVSGPGSFAAHEALQKFYEPLVDLIDELVETCQGRHGLMINIPTVDLGSEAKPVDTIRATVGWLEEHRAEAFGEDSALQNIVDEIVALHLRTIYRLENLQ